MQSQVHAILSLSYLSPSSHLHHHIHRPGRILHLLTFTNFFCCSCFPFTLSLHFSYYSNSRIFFILLRLNLVKLHPQPHAHRVLPHLKKKSCCVQVVRCNILGVIAVSLPLVGSNHATRQLKFNVLAHLILPMQMLMLLIKCLLMKSQE